MSGSSFLSPTLSVVCGTRWASGRSSLYGIGAPLEEREFESLSVSKFSKMYDLEDTLPGAPCRTLEGGPCECRGWGWFQKLKML